MIRQDESSRYEEFELLLVEEAKNEEVDLAYYAARTFYPENARVEVREIVRRALLELLGDGLILFYRSDRHKGYGLRRDEMEPVSRAEVGGLLEQGHWIDPPDRILFFRETEEGEALPPGAVPKLADML